MEIKEILSDLEGYKKSFPNEAVTDAITQKEMITPELLRILEQAEKNIHQIETEPDYMAHIYAMFILAQFREKRAYPLIINLFSYPGKTSFDIAGDFICEDLPRVLASVCDGDSTLIKQLVENTDANEYVRFSALKALLVLVVNGKSTRKDVIEYYESLFKGKLERKNSMVWNGLISFSSHLCAQEVYEDIKNAYNEKLIDPFFFSLNDMEEYFSRGWEKNLVMLKDDFHYTYVDDIVNYLKGWHWFTSEL